MNVITLHPPVIGLYAGASQSGKTTAALLIQDIIAGRHASRIVSFAEPLKLATAAFLEALGLSDVEATRYVFEDKDVKIPHLGRTGREFLVKLGTDCGREFVDPLCWVNRWKVHANDCLKARKAVVCDDVRTPDEARAVREFGGVIIEVRRPSRTGIRHTDPRTEGLLPGCTNYMVVNDGDLRQLRTRLAQTLRDAGVIH